MKVEDVPQDLKYFRNTIVRDMDYAVDNEGKYKMVKSDGWTPKNEALEVTLDAVNEECIAILKKACRGEASLLEYQMVKNLMTVELLAAYSGFSKRTVKRHLDPKVFADLDESVLSKYAEVLRITVDELKRFP